MLSRISKYALTAIIAMVGLAVFGQAATANAAIKSLTYSDESNMAYHIPLGSYPINWSNWPTRGGFGGCLALKSMPWAMSPRPGQTVPSGYPSNLGYEFNYNGDCRTAYTDGGTNTSDIENNITYFGAWLYPRAYGRWASNMYAPSAANGWTRAAVLTPCPDQGANDTCNHSTVIDDKSNNPYHNNSKQISYSRTPDNTNYGYMFARNGRTNWPNWAKQCTFSNGSYLIAKVFNVSDEEYEIMQKNNVSVTMSFAADDYASVYLNGAPIGQGLVASSMTDLKGINKGLVRKGTNYLAIQVVDRIVADSSGACWYNGRETGIRYSFVLEGDLSLPRWSITGRSQVSKTFAKPGEKVTFTHYLSNVGTQDRAGVNWNVQQRNPDSQVATGSRTMAVADDNIRMNLNEVTIPDAAKNGDKICQWINYPARETNGSVVRENSGEVCVIVQREGTTPETKYTKDPPQVPGEDMPWTHHLDNDESLSGLDGEVTFRQDINEPEMFVNDELNPKTFKFTSFDNFNFTTKYYPREEDIGRTICNWFTFKFSGTTPDGRRVERTGESAHNCQEVGKKPKVQIHGHDLRVGGKEQTSLMQPNYRWKIGGDRTQFGSWSEYGILVRGSHVMSDQSGMASTSMLKGGHYIAGYNELNDATGTVIGVQPLWHRLLFANTGETIQVNGKSVRAKGYYSAAVSRHDIFTDQFDSVPANGTSFPGYASANGVYDLGSNDITLGEGEIPAGRSIILRTTGTVTINGNITYPQQYTDISSIPGFVIVGGKVNITGNVSTIDPWVISKGKLNTCSDVSRQTDLNITRCGTQLRFNGPVATGEIELNRTFGSQQGTTEEPGEIFNYRASASVWARNYADSANRVQVTSIREVPPRF